MVVHQIDGNGAYCEYLDESVHPQEEAVSVFVSRVIRPSFEPDSAEAVQATEDD